MSYDLRDRPFDHEPPPLSQSQVVPICSSLVIITIAAFSRSLNEHPLSDDFSIRHRRGGLSASITPYCRCHENVCTSLRQRLLQGIHTWQDMVQCWTFKNRLGQYKTPQVQLMLMLSRPWVAVELLNEPRAVGEIVSLWILRSLLHDLEMDDGRP